MDSRKLYLDADRFEDLVMCKIEEIWGCDDKGDINIATMQGAWVNALEWVCQLIADESEVL